MFLLKKGNTWFGSGAPISKNIYGPFLEDGGDIVS